ncbi:hypothetical protein GX48_07541 [Paracoccidioides brasiliensis]|nr:hypothetical protein GX48_07541 [Paracoccidioides brasiliensis]
MFGDSACLQSIGDPGKSFRNLKSLITNTQNDNSNTMIFPKGLIRIELTDGGAIVQNNQKITPWDLTGRRYVTVTYRAGSTQPYIISMVNQSLKEMTDLPKKGFHEAEFGRPLWNPVFTRGGHSDAKGLGSLNRRAELNRKRGEIAYSLCPSGTATTAPPEHNGVNPGAWNPLFPSKAICFSGGSIP